MFFVEDPAFLCHGIRPEIGPQLRVATLMLFEKYRNLIAFELENYLYSIVRLAKTSRQTESGGRLLVLTLWQAWTSLEDSAVFMNWAVGFLKLGIYYC